MCYQRVITKIGIDKIAHFFASAFLVLALNLILPWWISALITVILSFLKELLDKKTGTYWDWKDIYADLLGIVISVILCLLSTLI